MSSHLSLPPPLGLKSIGEQRFLDLIEQVDRSISSFSENLHLFALLIDKCFAEEQRSEFLKVFTPGIPSISFNHLTLEMLRRQNVSTHKELIYRLHYRGRLELEMRDVMSRAEICLEKEIAPIIGVSSSNVLLPQQFVQNGKSILRRVNELHLSASSILNNSLIPAAKAYQASLFLTYLELIT